MECCHSHFSAVTQEELEQEQTHLAARGHRDARPGSCGSAAVGLGGVRAADDVVPDGVAEDDLVDEFGAAATSWEELVAF